MPDVDLLVAVPTSLPWSKNIIKNALSVRQMAADVSSVKQTTILSTRMVFIV